MNNATSSKERNPNLELFSVATIASQIIEDVEHIYGRMKNRSFNVPDNLAGQQISSQLGELKAGELIVVAARSKSLCEAFRLKLIQQVACSLKQTVVAFAMADSGIRFTRKLLDVMADIPSDAGIYDGQLDTVELGRLNSALAQLSTAHIYISQSGIRSIDDICQAARKQKEKAGIGLILADSIQWIMDGSTRRPNMQQNLVSLKQLAGELGVPVVALYQLDPTEVAHPSTLTRFELREVTELAKLTDRILLLSGASENLALARPKIPVQM